MNIKQAARFKDGRLLKRISPIMLYRLDANSVIFVRAQDDEWEFLGILQSSNTEIDSEFLSTLTTSVLEFLGMEDIQARNEYELLEYAALNEEQARKFRAMFVEREARKMKAP